MPRNNVTIYDLLLSCPGDVVDLIDIVKECIDSFNRLFGEVNKIEIQLKHWSTDSYPQSGGAAQNLLNKQFIHACDACIALFGNKFGSPTDKYESGTEEEIEDMIEAGKQVFMYFIDRPIKPSTIDMEQYNKVCKFKEKYSEDSKGIYFTVKDENEFKTHLLNHLTMYFLKLIDKPQSIVEKKYFSKLELKVEEDIDKKNHSNYCDSVFMNNKEEEIKQKIESIQNICLKNKPRDCDDSKVEEQSEVIANKQYDNIWKVLQQHYVYVKAEVYESDKKVIIEYCNEKGIFLNNEFWNLGNLNRNGNPILIGLNQSGPSLDGSAEEKRKYKLIEELSESICEYNAYYKWFSIIDSYSYLKCFVTNRGSSFDEDIDIKIKVPKECLVKSKEIPVPDIECIEDINEKNFVKNVFCQSQTSNIKEYEYYPSNYVSNFPRPVNIFGQSNSDFYKEQKEKYADEVKRIFCYQYYDEEKKDILKFNINYLKQNDSMYLPSILFFKKQPDYIEYEIISKEYPDVISEKIEIKNK